jgi:hypothetical protein
VGGPDPPLRRSGRARGEASSATYRHGSRIRGDHRPPGNRVGTPVQRRLSRLFHVTGRGVGASARLDARGAHVATVRRLRASHGASRNAGGAVERLAWRSGVCRARNPLPSAGRDLAASPLEPVPGPGGARRRCAGSIIGPSGHGAQRDSRLGASSSVGACGGMFTRGPRTLFPPHRFGPCRCSPNHACGAAPNGVAWSGRRLRAGLADLAWRESTAGCSRVPDRRA